MWKQDKLKYRKLTAPAVIGDYVIVGDYEGYVHWMSSSDGQLVARIRVDGDGILSPPVVQGGRAYIFGNSGDIAALEVALRE